MANSVNTAGLGAYVGQYSPQLIAKLFSGLTVANDVTVIPNVKNKIIFTKLLVGGVMRPYSATFSPPTGTLGYVPRTLEVNLGKGEWLLDPRDYLPTWQAQYMKPGVPESNKDAIPFSQFVWDKVMMSAAQEIDRSTVYLGNHDAAGTTAAAIATGYGTILASEITAGNVPNLVATGSLATDTVNKIEAVYKALPVEYRQVDTIAYVSWPTFDKYREDYRTQYKQMVTYNGFNQTFIAQSGNRCEIRPCIWMGNSGRVIITPKENMLMGTDLLSDLSKINAVPDVWTVKAGVAVLVGFQFRDLEALACNDVA